MICGVVVLWWFCMWVFIRLVLWVLCSIFVSVKMLEIK